MNNKSKAIIFVLALTNLVLLLILVLGPERERQAQKQLDEALITAQKNADELRIQTLRSESAIKEAVEKETIIARLRVDLTDCLNK